MKEKKQTIMLYTSVIPQARFEEGGVYTTLPLPFVKVKMLFLIDPQFE